MPLSPAAPTSASRAPLFIGAALLLALGVGAGVLAMRRVAKPALDAAGGNSVGDLAMANLKAKPDMCTGRDLKGTGVRMDIFATADTTQAALQSGLVPMLDLNVTPRTPALAGQTARWSGWIKAHGTGTHRFALPTGVIGVLSIGHDVRIDAGRGRADTNGSEMVQDRFYPFTLVVTVDRTSLDAGMWLLAWTPPSGKSEPVMRGSLFPPTPSTVKPTVVASAITTAR